jgi:putative Mg2+ transporter-C (MgtC) family protein
MLNDIADPGMRLLAAALVGMALGLDRDLHGKPTGVRTLGLVALGSALATATATHYIERYAAFDQHPDAASRVLQGLIQGILTGIGFIGAGVILHDQTGPRIRGLTTAATVWITAAIGIVCGLGEWKLLVVSIVLVLLMLVLGGPLERRLHRYLGGISSENQERDS